MKRSHIYNRLTDGTSFRPGPKANNIICTEWDRFWKVDLSAIEMHISDYADNGIIDNPIEQIYDWPARGNEHFRDRLDYDLPNSKSPLAPFIDLNGNARYEPSLGEYPAIKGDQYVWWIIHDE
jgi:hypothetical protein